MARPIEEVVREAQIRLEKAGVLNVDAWAARYPQYAVELRPLLETMLELHQERLWHQAEEQSRAYARGLFRELGAAPATLGHLFTRAQQEGVSTRLPGEAVKRLAQEETPVAHLDNLTLKQIASRIAVRFDELLKEVKRLRSLERLWSAGATPVMTRHSEESSANEQQELLERVKNHARKGNQEPQ